MAKAKKQETPKHSEAWAKLLAEANNNPEKKETAKLLAECRKRGFTWSRIAVALGTSPGAVLQMAKGLRAARGARIITLRRLAGGKVNLADPSYDPKGPKGGQRAPRLVDANDGAALVAAMAKRMDEGVARIQAQLDLFGARVLKLGTTGPRKGTKPSSARPATAKTARRA
jgi:hypothetical protein